MDQIEVRWMEQEHARDDTNDGGAQGSLSPTMVRSPSLAKINSCTRLSVVGLF